MRGCQALHQSDIRLQSFIFLPYQHQDLCIKQVSTPILSALNMLVLVQCHAHDLHLVSAKVCRATRARKC